LLLAVLPAAHAVEPQPFISSWGAALMPRVGKGAIPADEFRQVTLRQTVRLSLGGPALQVRVSNLHGKEALVIGAATVAAAANPGSDQLGPRPVKALLFDGAPRVVVPPGTEKLSDALDWAAARGDDVAISMYVESGPAQQSVHLAAHATQFIAPGDQTGRLALEGARPLTSWFQLGGVEVQAPARAGVLVAIGDSITDGSGSTTDKNERWTDFLVRRLQREHGPELAVINAGIGGNRMLHDDIGPHLLARFDHDVLDRPGVTHALVLVGVNDLGRLHRGTAETAESRQAMLADLQAGWRELVRRAHARGVCVIAGTLTPYGASTLYKPAPFNEADRQSMNQWLRTADNIDGVADFDAAVRDPSAPDRLRAEFDSGDHLHLSPAGYSAMAAAVPADRLAGCTPRSAAK
jgi:lysophospholipase L1-like esterase